MLHCVFDSLHELLAEVFKAIFRRVKRYQFLYNITTSYRAAARTEHDQQAGETRALLLSCMFLDHHKFDLASPT